MRVSLASINKSRFYKVDPISKTNGINKQLTPKYPKNFGRGTIRFFGRKVCTYPLHFMFIQHEFEIKLMKWVFLSKKSYDSLTVYKICIRPSYVECRPRTETPRNFQPLGKRENSLVQ